MIPSWKGTPTRRGHALDQSRIPAQGILELGERDVRWRSHILGIFVVFFTSEDRFVDRSNCSEHSDDFHTDLNAIVIKSDLLSNLIEREKDRVA